jgi:hypothetical protein
MYNRIKMSDYEVDGYLDGLDVVRVDYKELVREYRHMPGVLFLADPPSCPPT